MSSSRLYKVYKTKAVRVDSFQNGHGTASVLWRYMCKNYLNKEEHSWLMGDSEDLWELYNNLSVPVHMRFALMVTFDNGIVELRDAQKAADYSLATFETIYQKDVVNHWLALSGSYARYVGAKDRRCVGLALGCTSVHDPWSDDFESRKPFSIMLELDKQTPSAADSAKG